MTRDEAVDKLIEMCDYICGDVAKRTKQYEALHLAIEALKQPEVVECRNCRYYVDECMCADMPICGDDATRIFPDEDFYCANRKRVSK